ncbi:hypothetical protein DFS34DRAFT_685534 [Phlyctochytrium arcticum]|nr:hypothetical protein DFS34DRAFT_685534 [Phlyctochytrium arcticum]
MLTFKAVVLAAMARHRAATLVQRAASSTLQTPPTKGSLDGSVSSTAFGTKVLNARQAMDASRRRRTTRSRIDLKNLTTAGFGAKGYAHGYRRPPSPPRQPPPPRSNPFPLFPICLSTICLTIIAHKARTYMHANQSPLSSHCVSLFGKPTTADVLTTYSSSFRPEILLVAGYLMRSWVRGTPGRRKNSILSFLPPVVSIDNDGKAGPFQRTSASDPPPDLLTGESDYVFVSYLNELYPPLIAVINPEEMTREDCARAGVDKEVITRSFADIRSSGVGSNSADRSYEVPPAVFAESKSPNPTRNEPSAARDDMDSEDESFPTMDSLFSPSSACAAAKNLLTDVHDCVHVLASTVLSLATDWVMAATSLSTYLQVHLPNTLVSAEIKEEAAFLREYLRLCVAANRALDLPLLFPSEVEMDESGCIIKLKRSVWVVLVRALARSVAGAVVTVAPYLTASAPRNLSYFDSDTHASTAPAAESPNAIEPAPLDAKVWGLGLPEDLLTLQYAKMMDEGGFDEDGVDAW